MVTRRTEMRKQRDEWRHKQPEDNWRIVRITNIAIEETLQ